MTGIVTDWATNTPPTYIWKTENIGVVTVDESITLNQYSLSTTIKTINEDYSLMITHITILSVTIGIIATVIYIQIKSSLPHPNNGTTNRATQGG